MDTGLEGCTVLVTGASGGIGGATARAFALEGANLILHYHTRREAAELLHDEIAQPSLVVGADLAVEAEVESLFDEAIGEFGRIDAVVANAGHWQLEPTPLHEMTIAHWNAGIAANLTATFLTCRAFFRHLGRVPRERASLVFVSSTAAIFGEENHAEYSAAKAALGYGLTRTLKNEIVRLAPRGRVNCVAPGWTLVEKLDRPSTSPQKLRRITSTMALSKIAQPEDVAAAIVFLTSDRLAGHVSGAILPVAGGMEGRLLHSPESG